MVKRSRCRTCWSTWRWP